MNKIKNVVFDIGGVFTNGDLYSYLKKYFKSRQDFTAFLKEIEHRKMSDEWDKGAQFSEVIRQKIKQFPQYEEVLLDYDKNWINVIVGMIDGTVDLTLSLKRAGYKIFALTNWAKNKFEILTTKYDFLKYFDGIVVSADVKAIKPAPEIYNILCAKYNLIPQECVFLDDLPANAEGAKSIGMQAIVFKTPSQAKEALEKLGVIGK
ncbi:MAG: HAD family phosphatase [Elusimicrobiota bacterium]|jgi:2-haloacid dehalogenase|nr:HAD family phosphatase [Elusimicrobiota bacterium]